jgi:hypothetical protein
MKPASEESSLQIHLNDAAAGFRPGQRISGHVQWQPAADPCEALEVRLIWFTRGKGDRDVEVTDVIRFDSPGHQSSLKFEFSAPPWPCSFSGKLISLIWAIEVITFPDRHATHRELVISPTGQELTADVSESRLDDREANVEAS